MKTSEFRLPAIFVLAGFFIGYSFNFMAFKGVPYREKIFGLAPQNPIQSIQSIQEYPAQNPSHKTPEYNFAPQNLPQNPSHSQEYLALARSITPITDKVTTHSYQEMYGTFTNVYRGKPIKMMEIGLGCDMGYGPGASAQLWRKWLGPDAEIWFGEYDANCVQKHQDKLVALNISAVTGDQGDLQILDEWLKKTGGNFDFIVDDGGHRGRQKYNTFVKLWEAVKPRGIFFVEDLQVDRSPGYTDAGFPPFAAVLENWVDQLLIGSIFASSGEPTDATRVTRSKYPIPPHLKAIYCSDEVCAMKKCGVDKDEISRSCKRPENSIDAWKQKMLKSTSQS